MDMLGVTIIDLGLLCMFVGAVCVFRPLRLIGIRSRTRAAILGLCGVLAVFVGGVLPVHDARVPVIATRLDELTPVYQFHELHTTVVEASPERVYAAVKEVEPDEIFLFRTLTAVRRLGRHGAASILNPPAHQPILQTAIRTGFVPLADEPGREVVVGLIMSPLRMGWKPTPDEFNKANGPLLVKATMNFRIEGIDANHCTLTTETRMYGTDNDALRLVAMYWRVIYPGSALIRRMWLRAIRKRAESSDMVRPAQKADHKSPSRSLSGVAG
jgi:hypothetical protein